MCHEFFIILVFFYSKICYHISVPESQKSSETLFRVSGVVGLSSLDFLQRAIIFTDWTLTGDGIPRKMYYIYSTHPVEVIFVENHPLPWKNIANFRNLGTRWAWDKTIFFKCPKVLFLRTWTTFLKQTVSKIVFFCKVYWSKKYSRSLMVRFLYQQR